MRTPGIAARIVCAIIGAFVAPVATQLISAGGEAWATAQMQYGFGRGTIPFDHLAGPTLLSLLGMILLVVVVLTGLFSASGLLAAGVVGLVPLLGTMFPGLAVALFTSRLVPIAFLDPLYSSVPAAVLPMLGAMGVVLATIRRAPRRGIGSGVVGALVALIALALGGGLLMWGVQSGVGRVLRTLDTRFQPLPALLVLIGIALVAAGTMASRWSPWALAVPAVILLVLSIVNVLSPALYSFPLRDVTQSTVTFLAFGGGVAVALSQLAFTAVLLVQRARVRRASGPGAAANVVPGTTAASPAPPASTPPSGAPFAPPPPPAG